MASHFERMIRDASSAGDSYLLTMNRYRIQGIPESLAAATRATMQSPQYGHPAHVEVATGYGPCRLCLQTFTVGADERLLFTYQPFTDSDALPAPGPIFIHREPCERYDDVQLPEALRPLPLVLEAYGIGGAVQIQRRVGTGSFEAALDEVWAQPGIQYVHLRNAEAGCFIARIDRFVAQA
ncbi:MAG: DUF1203 domain-containing protein [Gemmatimonadales bacterium]